MHTLEEDITSPLCIIYMVMPQMIPLLTLTLVHTLYRRTCLKQYCWDRGVGIELEVVELGRVIHWAILSRWDQVQILNSGGY